MRPGLAVSSTAVRLQQRFSPRLLVRLQPYPRSIADGPGLSANRACAASKLANVSIINQGENGGTVKDLVSGTSPWGRLDFDWPVHGLNFSGSIHGLSAYGKPDIAGIMIGINDNLQGQVNPGTERQIASPA